MQTKEKLNKCSQERHASGDYAKIVAALEKFGLEKLTNTGQYISDDFIASVNKYDPLLYEYCSDPVEVSGYIFMEDSRGLRVNIGTKEYFVTRVPIIPKAY